MGQGEAKSHAAPFSYAGRLRGGLGRSESLAVPLPRLAGLRFPVPRWGLDLQRCDQLPCSGGDFFHRLVEHRLVGVRGLARSAQLADKLELLGPHLLICGGRLEVG